MAIENCKQESSTASFRIHIDVSEQDLDPIYRHVHHTKALLYLERARIGFLEKIGFSSEALIAGGLYPVIVSIGVRYRREIALGPIEVSCEHCRVERVLLRIKQRILNAEGRVLVEAQVDSALMSGKTKSAVPPSPEFVSAFNNFKSN